MKKINALDKSCEECGRAFNRTCHPSGRFETLADYLKRRFCSHDCYADFHRGKRHASYIPGGTVTICGYMRSVDPDGSGRRGLLHRILMEKKLGRHLGSHEHVHHRDGNPFNNDLANLEIIDASKHASMHSPHRKRDKKGQYA